VKANSTIKGWTILWSLWLPTFILYPPVPKSSPVGHHPGVLRPMYGLDIGRDICLNVPLQFSWHWNHSSWGVWFDWGRIGK